MDVTNLVIQWILLGLYTEGVTYTSEELPYRSRNNSKAVASPKRALAWVTAHRERNLSHIVHREDNSAG